MNTVFPSNIHQLAAASRVLLLQGPLGDFFLQLANWLQEGGSTVYKINFQAGDDWDFPKRHHRVFAYQDTVAHFKDFVRTIIEQHHIDAVVCFGDQRIYHQIAREVCQQKQVAFWVFEEGYFRPAWVTLEKGGVNASSALPKNAAFFQAAMQNEDWAIKKYNNTSNPFFALRFMMMAAIGHYLAMRLGAKRYPHYQHHRATSLFYYAKNWLRSFWRKSYYRLSESILTKKIEQGKLGRFYLFPLQVATDSQIRVHSDYESMKDCLQEVLASFAQHAPSDSKLIVKHHPMDRGFISYRATIKRFIQKQPELNNRILYVRDVSLPVLMRQAMGMVTINSTSALSALLHHLPTKVLGRANYDFEGLTCQHTLDEFWCAPTFPDSAVFEAYRLYHINHTQLAGSFYYQVQLPPNPYQHSNKRTEK